MNTATYRGMARNAEQRCEWSAAAKFWTLAIEKYPNTTGELAKLDIRNMTAKRDAALASAKQE